MLGDLLDNRYRIMRTNAPSMKPFMTCTIEQLEDAKKTIETLNPTGSLGPAGQEDDDHDLNLQRAGAGDVPGSPGGTGASAGGGMAF